MRVSSLRTRSEAERIERVLDHMRWIPASGSLMRGADDPWVVDGAAVRVSLICFASKDDDSGLPVHLDWTAMPSHEINADLTARAGHADIDLTEVHPTRRRTRLSEWRFRGDEEIRAVRHPRQLWPTNGCGFPPNPNGSGQYADVLRPWVNGMDLNTPSESGKWIIDFGWTKWMQPAMQHSTKRRFSLCRWNM